jgi:hypothetical protein
VAEAFDRAGVVSGIDCGSALLQLFPLLACQYEVGEEQAMTDFVVAALGRGMQPFDYSAILCSAWLVHLW